MLSGTGGNTPFPSFGETHVTSGLEHFPEWVIWDLLVALLPGPGTWCCDRGKIHSLSPAAGEAAGSQKGRRDRSHQSARWLAVLALAQGENRAL